MKFNKEKSKDFVSIECNEKIKAEKFGNIILTSFGIVLILFGSAFISKSIADTPKNDDNLSIMISEYDIERGKYLNKVHELREGFENDNLLDFYQNGKLVMNYNGERIESNLKALYLRYGYNGDDQFIFLSNVLNGRNVDLFTNENKDYAEDYPIIEFRNTTIFEELYNNYLNPILDNTIVLDEGETSKLITMIHEWDGKINDMVPETMAVQNKQVWEVNSDGKKR